MSEGAKDDGEFSARLTAAPQDAASLSVVSGIDTPFQASTRLLKMLWNMQPASRTGS